MGWDFISGPFLQARSFFPTLSTFYGAPVQNLLSVYQGGPDEAVSVENNKWRLHLENYSWLENQDIFLKLQSNKLHNS